MLEEKMYSEYVAPEKTGDELYDMMNDLASYREWLRDKALYEQNLALFTRLDTLYHSVNHVDAGEIGISVNYIKKFILGL